MNGFSEKVFLELSMPNDEDSVSDQKRIQSALRDRGFEHVTFPLHILRALYPMCRNADFRITVTLVYRETEWVVTAVEPGDQTHMHYGIAVDYGSTTIVMQLIDMRSGTVIDQVKAVNGQTAYGTDILLGDLFARTVISPVILPIGAITSFLGGPLFLYLLFKGGKKQ